MVRSFTSHSINITPFNGFSNRCGLWFGLVVEILDPVGAEPSSSVQRSFSAPNHSIIDDPMDTIMNRKSDMRHNRSFTVGKPATSHSPSKSDITIAVGQPNSSSALIRHAKRRCEEDCLFEQDLSRYKRVRLVSRQDRVRKPITMPGRWKRPRWSIYLHLDMEGYSHDALRETEMIFGLYHPTTVRAMMSLADMFRIRQKFEVSQKLLERAMTVHSGLDAICPLLGLSLLGSLALVFMDQNRLQEAEETCRLMASAAKTNMELDQMGTIVYQKKLHYVLQLAGKLTIGGSNNMGGFNSMTSYGPENLEFLDSDGCLLEKSFSGGNTLSTTSEDFVGPEDWMDGFFETTQITPRIFDHEIENGRSYHAVSHRNTLLEKMSLFLYHKVSRRK